MRRHCRRRRAGRYNDGSMLSRSAAAFFVAFLLVWFGFTTHEQARPPVPITGAQVQMQLMADSVQHEPFGSVEHHDPNDQPAQAQVEGGMDLPDLIQHLADARAPALAMVRPVPHLMAAWLTHTLDGLRRPPRGIIPTA